MRMCRWAAAILLTIQLAVPVQSQEDYLSPEEVQSALQGSGKKHRAYFIDMQNMFGSEASNGSGHGAQYPSIDVFMPDAWIAAQRDNAKKQYKPYMPSQDDTLRALTVVARGIATGTSAGPKCDSVSRVALISDKRGSVVIEAKAQQDVTETYQNGFGASAACSVLTAKFMLTDVSRVESAASKDNFFIGVFYSDGSSKLYEVKTQYRKDLGI